MRCDAMDYDGVLVKSPAGWVWLELGGCGFTDLQRTYSHSVNIL